MNYRFLLLFATCTLAACAPAASPHQQTSGGQHPSPKGTVNLIVRDQSTENEIAFFIRDGDEVFTDYGVSHTKEMHLIVVREDLRHFQHLHPERDSQGVWRVAFTPPAGGVYWRYADFVDRDQNPSTIRFDREYAGDPATYGTTKNFETVKTIDGYRFEMKPSVSDSEVEPLQNFDSTRKFSKRQEGEGTSQKSPHARKQAKISRDVSAYVERNFGEADEAGGIFQRFQVTFTYTITDSRRQPVQLEEYLGAKGHSILISPSGDFIHTHASEEGDEPLFVAPLPKNDFYRVFTQFQIKGKVITTNFDWSDS